jgi:hypothetical protein
MTNLALSLKSASGSAASRSPAVQREDLQDRHQNGVLRRQGPVSEGALMAKHPSATSGKRRCRAQARLAGRQLLPVWAWPSPVAQTTLTRPRLRR